MGFDDRGWQSLRRTMNAYLNGFERAGVYLREPPPSGAWYRPEPDAVFCFSGNSGWESGAIRNCPLVMPIHGGAVIDHAFMASHAHLLKTSDLLIANCTSDVTILDQLFTPSERPALVHLPLGVDVGTFTPQPRDEVRDELRLAADGFVIGVVGRILPQRNVHRVLEMAQQLAYDNPRAHIEILIIGAFWVDYPVLPYRTKEYANYIASEVSVIPGNINIHYVHSIDNDVTLARAYSSMDVLIHPTNVVDENFGYAPIEAMACGTPIIAYAYGGLKDTVVHNETGFLIPTWVSWNGIRADLQYAYDSLNSLFRSKELRRRFSCGARERAVRAFSVEVFNERLASCLKDIHRNVSNTRCSASGLLSEQFRSDLPPMAMGWEYFYPAASHYASTGIPAIGSDTEILLHAPLRVEEGYWVLQDPTWPARLKLTSSEAEIVELLVFSKSITPAAITLNCGQPREAEISNLLKRGVIVARTSQSPNSISRHALV